VTTITIAGVDQAGVGAFAGPIIAAAVIFAPGTTIDGLADSKLLSPKRREPLFAVISGCALAIGMGRAEVEEGGSAEYLLGGNGGTPASG
jgi:ribonuclease HII